MAKPIPDGYRTVTPYITVKGAAQAIDFYTRAFGAQEGERMNAPDGQSVMHAEIKIGDSIVMLSDEFSQMGSRSPQTLGGTTASIFLYVPDVDKAFKRAVDAGAKAIMPPADISAPSLRAGTTTGANTSDTSSGAAAPSTAGATTTGMKPGTNDRETRPQPMSFRRHV